MASLENRVAMVTGGGRGLGAAICRELGRAGASVIVADVRPEGAEATAEAIRKEGGRARAIHLDVTRDEDAAAVFGALDRLDALVNNAAVDFTVPIEELELRQLDAALDVNLRGPFVMSKLAVPLMKARGGGHIVNIASTASKRAWPNAAAYHATKWGLLGFSHALHAELRPHRIKVSAVVAGGMRTPFLLDRFPDIDPGVLQDPANVASTVRFLLTLPEETVIPEVMVIPMRESSWP
jgi:NAD(P)-dependent dehydrogenase (short-subunit alcohol dehydrogenase family)